MQQIAPCKRPRFAQILLMAQFFHTIRSVVMAEGEDVMNCPEKIAGVYLRLNGFFLLPHFTLFDGQNHTHVDFLALRSPEGRERCSGLELPLDQQLFDHLDQLIHADSLHQLLGAVVEVKGGSVGEFPLGDHLDYAHNFFGPMAVVVPLSFSREIENIQIEGGAIAISIVYSLNWVLGRFDWMNDNITRLSKSGSWNWSEAFLSDLLYLRNLGFVNVVA